MTPALAADPAGPVVGPLLFVSHATADKARFVEPFVRRLQEREVRVWIDRDRIGPGQSMVGEVFAGIGAADAAMVVLSRHSAASRWMQEELRVICQRRIADGLPVVVVRLDDAPVPIVLSDDYLVNVEPGTDWSPQLDLVVRMLLGADGPARRGRRRPGAEGSALRDLLADPATWIPAYELVGAETEEVLRRLADQRPGPGTDLPGRVHDLLAGYDEVTDPLVELLGQCGYAGDPGQERLWKRPLRRVMRTALPRAGRAGGEVWERAAWYPALRLSYAVGIGAVAGGREGLLWPMLSGLVPTARDLVPTWRVLCPHRVIAPDLARRMPGWTGSDQALSTHLRRTLEPAFGGVLGADEFADEFERYEYLRSLLELHLSDGRSTALGEFAWAVHSSGSFVATRITDELDALGETWPLLRAGAFGGSVEAVRQAQRHLQEHLQRRFF